MKMSFKFVILSIIISLKSRFGKTTLSSLAQGAMVLGLVFLHTRRASVHLWGPNRETASLSLGKIGSCLICAVTFSISYHELTRVSDVALLV